MSKLNVLNGIMVNELEKIFEQEKLSTEEISAIRQLQVFLFSFIGYTIEKRKEHGQEFGKY